MPIGFRNFWKANPRGLRGELGLDSPDLLLTLA